MKRKRKSTTAAAAAGEESKDKGKFKAEVKDNSASFTKIDRPGKGPNWKYEDRNRYTERTPDRLYTRVICYYPAPRGLRAL